MPKMKHEITQAREDALADRALKARAKLPPPSITETTHATAAKAKAAAARLGLPNTTASAVQTTHGWVGVVVLGADQLWLVRIVTEQGCRAEVLPEVAP